MIDPTRARSAAETGGGPSTATLFIAEPSLCTTDAHGGYVRVVGQAARRAGLDVVILHGRRGRGNWGIPDALAVETFDGPPQLVGDRLREVASPRPPRTGDHVLFRWLGVPELASVLRAIDRDMGGPSPIHHLFPAFDPGVLRKHLRELRPLFDRIAASPGLRRRVAMHAHGRALADAFSDVSGLPFEDTPIPVSAGRTPPSLGPCPILAFQGGADGFATLLRAMPGVWEQVLRPRRARLVLRPPEADDNDVADVDRQLRGLIQYPRDQVRLERGDVVPHALVVGAPPRHDLLRSLAGLAQAVADGTPTLRAAGVWLDGAGHGREYDGADGLVAAVGELVDDLDARAGEARDAAAGLNAHLGGQAFVDALLHAARARATPEGRLVLVVAAVGDTAVQRLRSLSRPGVRASGVLIAQHDANGASECEARMCRRLAAADLDRLTVLAAIPSSGLGRYGALERNAHVAAALRDAVAERRPDLIWVDDADALSWLQAAEIADIPVVLEPNGAPVELLAQETAAAFDCIVHATEGAAARSKALGARVAVLPPAATAAAPASLLAGCDDLADVVMACAPSISLAPPGVRASRAAAGGRLAARGSIDLVMEAAACAADVNALRWFLRTIYVPRLAPLGATLTIVGDVDKAASWPQVDGLVMVGPVDDPSPLIAAARVAAVPATGAAAWAAARRALSLGTPVIASPDAMDGVLGERPGVTVAEGAEDFAMAVRTLLASETARVEAATAALVRFGGPRRERDLDRLLNELLGVEPRPQEVEALGAYAPLEWSPELQAVQRLARAWSEGRRLASEDLRIAASPPRTRVRQILAATLEAFASRTALLLAARPDVSASIAAAGPLEPRAGLAAITAAIDVLGGFASDDSADVLWDAREQLRVDGRRYPAAHETEGVGRLSRSSFPGARSLVLEALAVDRPDIPAGSAADIGKVGELDVASGVHLVLAPPLLVGSGPGRRWIELVLEGDVAVTAMIGGRALAGRAVPGSQTVVTVPLPNGAAAAGLALMAQPLVVDVTEGVGRLVVVRTCLELGDAPTDSSAVAAIEAVDRRALQAAWVPLSRAVIEGRPPPAESLAVLAGRAAEPSLTRAGFWYAEPQAADVAAVLDARGWTDAGPGRLVASPGLTLSCEAEFASEADAEHVCARLDGRNGASRREGAVRTWTWTGRPPDAQGWRRSVVFEIDGHELAPTHLDWIVSLPGALDAATGSSCLERSNVYGSERNDAGAWSWTGPGARATIRIPVAATRPGQLRCIFAGPSDYPLPDGVSAVVNGAPVELSALSDSFGVEGEFAPTASPTATVELVLEVARVFEPPGDPRRLGVAIADIELRLQS